MEKMVNRRRGGPTTSEIARVSGLSRSTVSAVLNGRRNVRESTRERVLACIRKQHYESSMIARTLVSELSQMVAVLAPNLGSPFHMMAFRGINKVLVDQGYHILFHNVLPEGQEAPETMDSLLMYQAAGYIVLRGGEGRDAKHARAILQEGVPLVSMGILDGVETHAVTNDNRLVTRMATDYVIEHGHRRLGYLGLHSISFGPKERQLGFVESLINHDIPVSEAVIADAGLDAKDGYSAALSVLKNPKTRPTALVCFNDMLAVQVYRAAHELSLNIPGDLSVVGVDGIDFLAALGPPLTTVDIFPEQSGGQAADLLVKAIRNQLGRSATVQWIEPKLLERGSVGSI